MPVRRKLIQQMVQDLLSTHGIQHAPVPIERIARELGITIKLDEVDDELSGFLFRDKDTGTTIIGANKSHPPNRLRFTIAHELGHFLLHEGERIHMDEKSVSYTVDFRDGRSGRGEDDKEKEANFFAAELLMPSTLLRQDLAGKRLDLFEDGDALEKLAKKYKVSLQALTFKLTNLGYIQS